MSFNFTVKEFILGGGTGTPTFQFYKKGFNLYGGSHGPSWQDIVLSGNGSLTLVNAKENGLNYVKLYGGTEQRNLPSEYTQLDYVSMEEGSYAVGLTQPVAYGRVEFDFKTTQLYTSSVRNYYGGRYDNAPVGAGIRLTHVGGSNPKDTIYAFDTTQSSSGNYTFANNTRYKFVYNNSNVTLTANGVEVINRDFTTNDTTTSVVAINSYRTQTGSISNSTEHIYVYTYKVYDSQGNLIENWIPARKGTTVCFYDTVSGTDILPTEGTFTAGADVTTPSPNTPMDIVSNNGVLKYGFNYYSYNIARQLSVENYQVELDRSISYSEGVLTCGITGSVSSNRGMFPIWNMYFTGGHKYACVAMAKGDSRINLGLSSITPSGSVTGASSGDGFYTLTSNYVWYAKLWECNTDSMARLNIRVAGTDVGQYASFKDILVIDLTAIFGTGNEPTTASDIIQSTVKIYTDGTVETVNVHGKNLFDVDNNLLAGYYINTTTGILTRSSDGSSSCFKDFLPSKPNITYTMSRLLGISTALRMWAYDKDKNPISLVFNSELGAKEITGTTPNDTAYIRCSFGSIPQYSQNVQLEQGSTATTYKPYYNGGSATAEMLLKVGNYQDIQSVLDGNVTRNVGVKVLDGTEDWQKSGTGTAQDPIRFAVSEFIIFPDSDTIECLSTHYPFSGVASTGSGITPCTFNIGIYNNIHYIRFAPTDITTLTDWTDYLKAQYNAGHPVIIVYPLATATTEVVTAQSLTTQQGTNIVEIIQASINNLGLEVSYKGTI